MLTSLLSNILGLADLLPRYGGWIVAGLIVVIGLFAVGWNDVRRFSFKRAWAISSVCFDESIRRRVLWITPLAILGVIITAQLQRPFDEQDAIRQTIKFSLFATGLLVAVTTIILACTNLPREIENRVIYTVVTKPTTRLEIVLGKVLGFARVSAAILLIMGVFMFAYLHLRAAIMHRDIDARLQAGIATPTEVPTLEHYRDVGLLRAKSLALPNVMQIYAQLPPEEDGRRWLSGGGVGEVVVPFRVRADQLVPPDAPNQPPGSTGLLILARIGYQRAAGTLVSDEDNLPIGVVAPDAPDAGVTRPPTISVQILDRNMYAMLGRDVINNGEPIQLLDAEGQQPVIIPIAPTAMSRIVQEGEIWVHITGTAGGFMYSFTDDAVQLVVPGASPGVISEPIGLIERGDGTPANIPFFRGRRGSLGQQLRGGRDDTGGVAVYQFRNVHPNATAEGNVPIELRVGIEGSPDDEEDERPTQVQLVVQNLETGQASAPVTSYIESNRSLFLHVPAESMRGGNFDVRLRCLTPGRYLGLGTESLTVVQARQSFAFNLFKSLLILWLMAILIITISIFCSTFLSWPIAIVLTLVLLLGHWGVEQLDDALQPGVGASIATDLGFRDPGQTRVVSVAVEGLSRALDTLASILPNISRFAAAEDIERGLAIPMARLGESLAVVLLFGLPMLVLGYVFLRNKEVAP